MPMLICSNCGASFDAKEPKCPFCGAISYPGAEEKYMRDLHNIRDNLESVSEIPPENFEKEVSKQSKFLLKTFIIIGVIFLIVFLVILGLAKLQKRFTTSTYSVKDEMHWLNENVSKLDEMYANKEYDKILAFQMESEEEKMSYFGAWEHANFMNAYSINKQIVEISNKINNKEELTKYEREDIVYYALWYHFDQYDTGYETYTDEEKELIQSYKSYSEEVFYGTLKFTDEEADKVHEKCMKNGYFSAKYCYQYADRIYTRFVP